MAVYRFRIKGNGSAGGVKYTDGMNVEVANQYSMASLAPILQPIQEQRLYLPMQQMEQQECV